MIVHRDSFVLIDVQGVRACRVALRCQGSVSELLRFHYGYFVAFEAYPSYTPFFNDIYLETALLLHTCPSCILLLCNACSRRGS